MPAPVIDTVGAFCKANNTTLDGAGSAGSTGGDGESVATALPLGPMRLYLNSTSRARGFGRRRL